MSSFKPRRVAEAGMFVNDHRPDKKFWLLDPVVQPTVQVLPSGLFKDPTPTVLQAFITPTPLEVALDLVEANGIAGDFPTVVGLPDEVIELRSVTLTSAAGGNYAILDDGVQVSPILALGPGLIGEMVNVGIPVAGTSVITIQAGLAADAYSLRGLRLS